MGACGSKGSTSDKGLASDKDGKNAKDRKEAWERIRQAIPREKTAEAKQRRIELFKKFDKNETGKLCYDEVYSGCLEVLKLDEFTSRVRDITKRAFDKARALGSKLENKGSEDFVEFLEFRLMLCYIYDFFELTVMFDEIDASGNMLVDEEEFKRAVPKLEAWAPRSRIPAALFKELDKNGTGSVTFDEFAAWASAVKLDADGDPDNVPESA
ncbi:flagellar calcium-binding 24 kDa protein [Trypanosoma cruzi]|nr:flagellar calcium-binding 24 kDa protein [Trypanosoma cruzi]